MRFSQPKSRTTLWK